MFDKLLAFLLLIFLCPAFIIIALFVLLDDGTPVFFIQKRVGKDYTFFMLYKFRTMKKNTPNVATHLLENPEKYVLKVGSILRKFSLDELPNLLNICKGEMVFVGPRPALYNQKELMKLRINAGVFHLKPGLTGWAQINCRDEISNEEKVALEKDYLERKSFLFDVKIFFMTFSSAFFKKDGLTH